MSALRKISIVVLTLWFLLVAGAVGPGVLHQSAIGVPDPSRGLMNNAVELGGEEMYQEICIVVIDEAVVFFQVIES